MTLSPGLYDLLLIESVARRLLELQSVAADAPELGAEELPERVVEELGRQLPPLLDELGSAGSGKVRAQLALVNELPADLRGRHAAAGQEISPIAEPPRILRAIHKRGEMPPTLPDTGLVAPWLFTASRGSPSLLGELRREAAACDRSDILVNFITISGVRKLIDVLRSDTASDAAGEGRTKIHALTTTYNGATELAALNELARLNGCEVRVSLNGRRTRHRAKARPRRRRPLAVHPISKAECSLQ